MSELRALLARQLRDDVAGLPRRLAALAGGEARLARCHSIADLRALARRRTPGAVFDFVDGAAGAERTAARNERELQGLALRPRVLAGGPEVARDTDAPAAAPAVPLGTRVLGRDWALPLAIAPTGLCGLVHPAGEIALAQAAHTAGTVYTLSCMASHTLEDVARASGGASRGAGEAVGARRGELWLQAYLWRDRGLVADLLRRAAGARYRVLVVTVDVPVAGSRERDLRNGFGVPPRLTPRTAAAALRRPGWTARFVRDPRIRIANVASDAAPQRHAALVNGLFDPRIGWADIAWLRERWDGPLVVKGILRGDDARTAVATGADAVWVSNHGGRQLDGAVSSIRALPAVADAVGTDAEVLLDGGVRTGADILRALALGARAVLVGRPALYGLAAGGRAGVQRALSLLRDDLARACLLAGLATPGEASRELLADAWEGWWTRP